VRDGGAIVNLSDAVLGSTTQVYGVSGATAAAADVLTRLLADELGRRGVTVVEYLLSAEGRGRTGRVIRIDESDGTEPPPFPTVAVQ